MDKSWAEAEITSKNVTKLVVFPIHNRIIHFHPAEEYVLQGFLLAQAHEYKLPLKQTSGNAWTAQ